MKEALISCVVPTLNSAVTLDATLLSLLSQQAVPVAVLVADSGSTDDTLALCRRWNVPHFHVEPGNMYRAINAGLSQHQTEWLAYLNSDDWIYPDSYARLIAHGEATQADIVYGNCDFADGRGRFIYSFTAAQPHQLLPLFRTGIMGLWQPAVIFRKRLYDRMHGFDEQYSLSADADFFMRAAFGGARFAFLNGPSVACFRVHEQQLSHTKTAAMEAEKRAIREAAGKPGLKDRCTLLHWRFRNMPQYCLRILRASLLAGKLRAPASMETHTPR